VPSDGDRAAGLPRCLGKSAREHGRDGSSRPALCLEKSEWDAAKRVFGGAGNGVEPIAQVQALGAEARTFAPRVGARGAAWRCQSTRLPQGNEAQPEFSGETAATRSREVSPSRSRRRTRPVRMAYEIYVRRVDVECADAAFPESKRGTSPDGPGWSPHFRRSANLVPPPS